MERINFKQNIKTYALNDDEAKTISISTTDYAILDRIKKSLKEIEKISDKYKACQITDSDSANELFVSADKDIREQINYILGSDVCTMAFGNCNCLSLCDDGSAIFENFINAVIPVIKNDVEKAQAKQNKHIEKYTSQAKKFVK